MPEFARQLLAKELKEWTLAQGEQMLGNGVQQLDCTTHLQNIPQLSCRTDDAVRDHWNRLQESSSGQQAATAEQWPPKQGAKTQAQRWAAAKVRKETELRRFRAPWRPDKRETVATTRTHSTLNRPGREAWSP